MISKTEFRAALTELGYTGGVARLRSVFRDWDTNADGVISKDEFIAALNELGVEDKVAAKVATKTEGGPCAPIFSRCFWANFSTMSRNGHPPGDSVAWRAHSTNWPDSFAWHTYTTGGVTRRYGF